MSSEPQQRGPSWYDVSVATGELETRWSVHASFRMARAVHKGAARGELTVVLDLTKADRTAWEKSLPGLVSTWPHIDHKTMPGLMMKMLYIINERLLEKEETAKKTAQSALPF